MSEQMDNALDKIRLGVKHLRESLYRTYSWGNSSVYPLVVWTSVKKTYRNFSKESRLVEMGSIALPCISIRTWMTVIFSLHESPLWSFPYHLCLLLILHPFFIKFMDLFIS